MVNIQIFPEFYTSQVVNILLFTTGFIYPNGGLKSAGFMNEPSTVLRKDVQTPALGNACIVVVLPTAQRSNVPWQRRMKLTGWKQAVTKGPCLYCCI